MTNSKVDRKSIREQLIEVIHQQDEGVLAAENAGAAQASKRKQPAKKP
jgi:hypothetical protein